MSQIKMEQVKQNDMERELSRLIKDEEKSGKRINAAKASIQRTNDAITTSNNDIVSITAQIEAQKTNVQNNAADPNASKGAKKTLSELENQKRSLQKQNDKRGKEILNWDNEIRAEERATTDYKQKQAIKKSNIEAQKRVVQQVQIKLDGIK